MAPITGGNGGLGRAIALGLRKAGASIAVTGRNQEKNAAVASELGDPAAVFALDVRDEAAVEQTVTGVVERHGRLDILVTCAGDFARGSGARHRPPGGVNHRTSSAPPSSFPHPPQTSSPASRS